MNNKSKKKKKAKNISVLELLEIFDFVEAINLPLIELDKMTYDSKFVEQQINPLPGNSFGGQLRDIFNNIQLQFKVFLMFNLLALILNLMILILFD